MLALGLMASGATAQSLTSTWSNVTGDWSAGANWGGSAPVSSNETVLYFGGGTYLASNNIANPFILNTLVYTGATAIATNRGFTLEFQASGSGVNPLISASGAGQFVIQNVITNLATTLRLSGNGAGTLTLAGAIKGTGSGALVKDGTGRFVLAAANSFGGGVTISNGTLQINNAAALGTGGVTLSGGTLMFNSFNGTGSTVSNNISVTSSSALYFDNGNNGTTIYGNGGLTISDSTTLTVFNAGSARAGTLRLRGASTLGSNVTLVVGGLSGANGNDSIPALLALSNTVTAANGFNLVGGSLGLAAANNGIAGNVGVSNATVYLVNTNALGTGTFTFTNNSALFLTAATAYTNSDLTINTNSLGSLTFGATNAMGSRTIAFENGTLTLNAPGANLAGGLTVPVNSAVTIAAAYPGYTGPVTNAGGIVSLTATGALVGPLAQNAGTLTLSATNALTGQLTMGGGTVWVKTALAYGGPNIVDAAGTMVLSNAAALGAATISFTNGATLQLSAVQAYTNSTLTVNTNGLRTLVINRTNSVPVVYEHGNLTLNAAGALLSGGMLVRTGSTVVVNADYSGYAGPITNVGGTVTLSATNGYAGSVVNGYGTFNLTAPNSVTLNYAFGTLNLSATGASIVTPLLDVRRVGTTTNSVTFGAAYGGVYNGQVSVNGGTLTLSASNAFSGPLTYNYGVVSITAKHGYTGSNFVVRLDPAQVRTWNLSSLPQHITTTASGSGATPFGTGALYLLRGVVEVAPSAAGLTTISQPIVFGSAGDSYLYLRPNGSGTLEWTAPSLTRSNQGGLFIGWDGSLGTATASNRFYITGQAVTNFLAPYVVVGDSTGSRNPTFAQYTANGIARASLTTPAIVSGVVTAPLNDGTENLNITNTAAIGANLDVLSLRLINNAITLSRNNGAGYTNIIIRSGGVIGTSSIGAYAIQPDLYFGIPGSPVEAIIWQMAGQNGTYANRMVLSGNLTANGLTKFGMVSKSNDGGTGLTWLDLSGNNNILGRIAAMEGYLVFNSAGALNDSNTVFTAEGGGAYFNVNETIAGLEGTGGIGSSANAAGAYTRQVRVVVATNTTYSAGISLSDESAASSRFFSLIKDGPGTQILNSTNTYTGATLVNNGTLQVNGALGNTAVTVSNGANFVLHGSIGTGSGLNLRGDTILDGIIGQNVNVNTGVTLQAQGTFSANATIANGGTLAPGSSPGTLFVAGNLTLDPGATLAVNLDGYAPGTGYDQIIIGPTGFFNVSDATLKIASLNPTLTNGTKFVLLFNQNENSYGYGSFSNAPDGTPFQAGGVWYQLDYVALDGDAVNDVVLTLIPEPNALTLVGAGLALLLLTSRRGLAKHGTGC